MSELDFSIFQSYARAEQTNHVLAGLIGQDVEYIKINDDVYGSEIFIEGDPRKWRQRVPLTALNNVFQVSAGQAVEASGELASSDNQWWYADTNMALFATSGEFDASGEWKDPDYRSDRRLRLDGWKQFTGPWATLNVSGDFTRLNTYNGLTTEDHPVLNQMRLDGLTSQDNLWTYLFRKDFEIDASTTPIGLELAIVFRSAAAIYLNGSMVWKSDNLDADWLYMDYASDLGPLQETIDLTSYLPLLSTENTIAVVLKSQIDETALLDLSLNIVTSGIDWSEPKTITVKVAGGTVVADHNFNNLDRLGLVFDLPRLPGEKNQTYQERLINYTSGQWPHNASVHGIYNGIALRLGTPVGYAFTIKPKATYNRFNCSDVEFWIKHHTASITCNLCRSVADFDLDLNTRSINVGEDVIGIHSIAYLGQTINPVAYYLEQGKIYFRDINIPVTSLTIDYSYAFQYSLVNKTIAEVVEWIKSLTIDGLNLFVVQRTGLHEVTILNDVKVVATDGSDTATTDVKIEDHDVPDNLMMRHQSNGVENAYRVISYSGRSIELGEAFDASGDPAFLNVSGEFVPGASGEINSEFFWSPQAQFLPEWHGSGHEITVPQYQIALERLDDHQFELIFDPEPTTPQSEINEARRMIDAVRRNFRATWAEQVLGLDVWDAVAQRLIGGGKIPAYYDMNKALYQSRPGGRTYLPEVAEALTYVDPDPVEVANVVVETVIPETKQVYIKGRYATDFLTGKLQRIEGLEDGVPFYHTVVQRENLLWFADITGKTQHITVLTLDSVDEVRTGDTWRLEVTPQNEMSSVLFKADDFVSGCEYDATVDQVHADMACLSVGAGEVSETQKQVSYIEYKLLVNDSGSDYYFGYYQGVHNRYDLADTSAMSIVEPSGEFHDTHIITRDEPIGFYLVPSDLEENQYQDYLFLNRSYNYNFSQPIVICNPSGEITIGDNLLETMLLSLNQVGRIGYKEVEIPRDGSEYEFIIAACSSGEVMRYGPDIVLGVKLHD